MDLKRSLQYYFKLCVAAGRRVLTPTEIQLTWAQATQAHGILAPALRSPSIALQGSYFTQVFFPTTSDDSNKTTSYSRWGPLGDFWRIPESAILDRLLVMMVSSSPLIVGAHTQQYSTDKTSKVYRKKQEGFVRMEDDKPILLFDLNGTVVKRGKKKKQVKLRPGLEHLLRLKGKFHLGIFTSSTEPTVEHILHQIRSGLAQTSADEIIFDERLIFHRAHTAPKRRVNGKSWDTMKPLHPLFEDLSTVILFDNDLYKACPGEESNMVLVPSWEGEDANDRVLKVLVDCLLQSDSLMQKSDVRSFTRGITSSFQMDSNDSHGSEHVSLTPDPGATHDTYGKGNISSFTSAQRVLESTGASSELKE